MAASLKSPYPSVSRQPGWEPLSKNVWNKENIYLYFQSWFTNTTSNGLLGMLVTISSSQLLTLTLISDSWNKTYSSHREYIMTDPFLDCWQFCSLFLMFSKEKLCIVAAVLSCLIPFLKTLENGIENWNILDIEFKLWWPIMTFF